MKIKHNFTLLSILLFCILIPCSLFAGKITREQAHNIALEFFNSNSQPTKASNLVLVYEGNAHVKSGYENNPALYIYSNAGGKGFVIVAGDDIAYPVLGYSFDNTFHADNIPQNIKGWIDGLERRINYGRENNYPSLQTQSTKAAAGTIVQDLMTANWDQSEPYDKYIPTFNGQKCPTGCVPTATAIVMYHHKYPEKGKGKTRAYQYEGGMIIPEIQLGHIYNWSKMLPQYLSGLYTEEEADQVAILMRDLGHAMFANYTPAGTGAALENALESLISYFDYDKSGLYCDRDTYSNSEWISKIKSEIDNNRPVMYSGFNDKSGHAFVMDGYTTDNYFKVNWGWGGYYNGFFILDALDPNGSGIGGNNDHYNFNQSCLINLKPNNGGDYIEHLSVSRRGIIECPEKFETGKKYQILVEEILNTGNCKFYGYIALAHTNKSGEVKEFLNLLYIEETTNFYPKYGYSNITFNFTINKPIEDGDKLRLLYMSHNKQEWIVMKGGEECTWELLISKTEPIEKATGISYNKEQQIVSISTDGNTRVQLFNSNGSNLSTIIEVKDKIHSFSTKGLPSGTYSIKLTRNAEVYEFKIKL